ncbi:hypothetical protein BJAS_P4241 [Bathymodiolus japonicus methanotrophic gill symbiont]|nr:hypothetical protein BJAS_P3688 [Bathymodiolus japonicus methanotrophic gill symbiont]GFO73433.1 hypothetical protein BJAS_P4241 [Bathymodiolus japonicus methanotrophic gill symbiont]
MLFPNLVTAGNSEPIFNSIKPHSITIIGEQHRHPESIEFFQSLIKGYLKKDSCLTVALEINSNQQPIIEKIERGMAVASDFEISQIIDQPALRRIIAPQRVKTDFSTILIPYS